MRELTEQATLLVAFEHTLATRMETLVGDAAKRSSKTWDQLVGVAKVAIVVLTVVVVIWLVSGIVHGCDDGKTKRTEACWRARAQVELAKGTAGSLREASCP